MTLTSTLHQTILHWLHQRGGEAHCLARLYKLSSQQVIVVLSSIRTNPLHQGLTLDMSGAANALQPTIEKLGLPPASVTWIAHHGQFSNYDALDQETFSLVTLKWDDGAWVGELTDWSLLPPATANQLKQTVELVPVLDVLEALDWPPL